MEMGSPEVVSGAEAVAQVFWAAALGAPAALVDGIVGSAAPGGNAKVVWDITVTGDRITRIDMVAAADSLEDLDLVLLD